MKKLAIIGASYLQVPLINKAKQMGIETHVFAWGVNDVGEKIADHFYPISITEKDAILLRCIEIGINGICSIASDLAVITVNYVAEKMGLIGNGQENTYFSTNKYNMRCAFYENGDPSPKSILVRSVDDIDKDLTFPVIVKPLDRSGSRGIFKVDKYEELNAAILNAEENGFIKNALIEEYVEGEEYSVECISYNGKHNYLAITQKYTTGAPRFVEIGHLEPALLSNDIVEKIVTVIFHALDTLRMKNGASHSEIKITPNGEIKIIEIGSRMGGDFIGSTLVHHSSGVDFVRAVIQIALGEAPCLFPNVEKGIVGIRYICATEDFESFYDLKMNHPEYILEESIPDVFPNEITDSSSRAGYFIFKSNKYDDVSKYLPRKM